MEQRIYDALVVPTEALDKGGVEILRAGLIDDELYVTARHAFSDPAVWGEVLADIARRLALLHAREGEHTEAEVLAAIESAFAADLGARQIKARKASTARRTAGKGPARAAPAKKPARKATKKPAKAATKAAKRSKR